MKVKILTVLFILSTITLVAFFGFKKHVEKNWERSLKGPFFGIDSSGEVPLEADYKLALPDSELSLCLFEKSMINGPVLILRSSKGHVIWAKQLSVTNEVEKLRRVELVRAVKYDSGYKIKIVVEWEMGKEAGLVYLGTDFSFQNFKLGW